MNGNNTLLDLCKANVQWQMNVTRLLQQGSHHWLEAAHQVSADSMARTTAQAEDLLRAEDQQAMLALPSQAVASALQGLAGARGTLANAAVQNQMDFTSGLQQALRDWQQAVTAATSGRAQADSWISPFEQWRFPWPSAASSVAGKPTK